MMKYLSIFLHSTCIQYTYVYSFLPLSYIFCPILLHFLFFIYLFKVFFFKGRGASFHFFCACTPCRSILCFIICLLFCSWEMKIFDFSLSSINILVSGQNYVKYGQNLDCHSCFATHLQLLYLKLGSFFFEKSVDFVIPTLARFPFSQQSKSLLIISCFLRFNYSNFKYK